MIQSWSLAEIYLFQGWIKAWGGPWPCCTQPCTSQINPHHIRDEEMENAGLMPGDVTHALTGPGMSLLVSGWHSLSLLDCHPVTDVTNVTNVTLLECPCWPDQCQCVTACKALYTCTLHMSLVSPAQLRPHLDRDRSQVLATASVHRLTQATIICALSALYMELWRKWKKIKIFNFEYSNAAEKIDFIITRSRFNFLDNSKKIAEF